MDWMNIEKLSLDMLEASLGDTVLMRMFRQGEDKLMLTNSPYFDPTFLNLVMHGVGSLKRQQNVPPKIFYAWSMGGSCSGMNQ